MTTFNAEDFYGPWRQAPYNSMIAQIVGSRSIMVEPSLVDMVLSQAVNKGIPNGPQLRVQLLRSFEVTTGAQMPEPDGDRLLAAIKETDEEYNELEQRFRVAEESEKRRMAPVLKHQWNKMLALNGMKYVYVDKVPLLNATPNPEAGCASSKPMPCRVSRAKTPMSKRSGRASRSPSRARTQISMVKRASIPSDMDVLEVAKRRAVSVAPPSSFGVQQSRPRMGTSVPRELSDRRPILTASNGIPYRKFTPQGKRLVVHANHVPDKDYEFGPNNRSNVRFYCLECRNKKRVHVRAFLCGGVVYTDEHVCTPDVPPKVLADDGEVPSPAPLC